jgi:hypothetical protein
MKMILATVSTLSEIISKNYHANKEKFSGK